MKQFNFNLSKGDHIQVSGSKVKTTAGAVLLASELRRGTQKVYLRDSSGNPNWPEGT